MKIKKIEKERAEHFQIFCQAEGEWWITRCNNLAAHRLVLGGFETNLCVDCLAKLENTIKHSKNDNKDGLVIVPPCKVGDEVFVIDRNTYNAINNKKVVKGKLAWFKVMKTTIQYRVCNLTYPYKKGKAYNFSKIFLTEAEAEKALELENENDKV